MGKCVICKQNDIEQKHHISYDPEIIIEICTPCHVLLHKHGVGLPKGATPIVIEEPPEQIPLLPTYTKRVKKDNTSFVVTIEDEEILNWVICPNGCKSAWSMFQRKNAVQNQFILRCPHCGYDILVERIG